MTEPTDEQREAAESWIIDTADCPHGSRFVCKECLAALLAEREAALRERCAKVAESTPTVSGIAAGTIASAIRALKDEP